MKPIKTTIKAAEYRGGNCVGHFEGEAWISSNCLAYAYDGDWIIRFSGDGLVWTIVDRISKDTLKETILVLGEMLKDYEL